MNSFNKERLQTIIHRNLSNILQKELKQPQLKNISLIEIKLNKDKSIATAYYSFIDSDNKKEYYNQLLDENLKIIRQKLSQKLKIFKVPELRFKYDVSLNAGSRIEQILNNF